MKAGSGYLSVRSILPWVVLKKPAGWDFTLLNFCKKVEYTGIPAGNTVDYPVLIHSPQAITFS